MLHLNNEASKSCPIEHKKQQLGFNNTPRSFFCARGGLASMALPETQGRQFDFIFLSFLYKTMADQAVLPATASVVRDVGKLPCVGKLGER